MTRFTHQDHVAALTSALQCSGPQWRTAEEWGRQLSVRLPAGGRLLVAGNGGSAAQAQHLCAEIVGRYQRDRRPLSAIALNTDTAALTAIVNDYGPDEVFARQVQAHASPDTIVLLLSTSGRSANVLRAAERARAYRMTVWAMTGPAPNPLADLADIALCIDAPTTATVQELHLAAVHIMCEALDECLLGLPDELAARLVAGEVMS